MGKSDCRNARLGWPPAEVDLMFGATQAAKRWSRKMQKKDLAEGRKQERIKQRAAMHKRLSKFAGQGMTPEQLQEVIDELADGGGQDGQK